MGDENAADADITQEDTFDALKFRPDETMAQDRSGVWRYKRGTFDEFGNNISGHFVKGAPRPGSFVHKKLPKELEMFLNTVSVDAAQILYNLMMDDGTSDKVRFQCAQAILDRSLGKPKQQVDFTSETPADLIQPIVISDAIYKKLEAQENDNG